MKGHSNLTHLSIDLGPSKDPLLISDFQFLGVEQLLKLLEKGSFMVLLSLNKIFQLSSKLLESLCLGIEFGLERCCFRLGRRGSERSNGRPFKQLVILSRC